MCVFKISDVQKIFIRIWGKRMRCVLQDKCTYRGRIHVQSTEMEESSARSYTKICRLVIRE